MSKELTKKKTELLKKEGLVARNMTVDWYWIKNAIIEKFGKEIGPYGIAVYSVLAMYANRGVETFVSHKKIAELLNISRRMVIIVLSKLEELKLIKRFKRNGTTSVCYLTGGTTLKVKHTPDGSDYTPPDQW